MADTPSEDAPGEITVRTSPHATATSRPSAPRKSPAAPMLTRARKLKAAANRLQKGSSSSTPTSRPRVRGIGKLLTPRRRQAPKVKAATAKNAMQTAAAAAEEAAATIPLAPRPPQLHLVPTQKEGSKAELQDDQKPLASTPAGSEEQTSTESSSPTSSSSWEHNTPLTSSPSLSPSPRALACFRTGICADRPGRQRAIQQALFAASPRRARTHSAPPATSSCPRLLAVQACRAGRQEDVVGEGCACGAVSPFSPGEEKRVTSTGKATLDSLAQAGVSQSVTGNPTLLETSPLSSVDATRAPNRVASLLSDGVVCLPPTSLPQPQQSPPLSHSKERTGASSATAGAPPNSAASTAPPPPSAFGPMRPLTVHAFTEADYGEARRKHRQKNGFPRLSWRPAVDDLRKGNRKVLIAARSLLARGRGCTPALALRVYNAVASARVLYRAPVASLSACQLAALDTDHRNAVREYYALPHNSQVGPTLAEAGETPISLRITKTALNHVWRLNNTAQGGRLVDRLHSLPHSSLGQRATPASPASTPVCGWRTPKGRPAVALDSPYASGDPSERLRISASAVCVYEYFDS
ncbi:hypothetical protein HPB52_023450 [Rhipicephalus sanguineus]|uniref:Uncharacterized protein n=1 Tax=Rhipicephalus sanguineus TaxID=34632 RepID=A0A9D4Q661_RHISA|nr:hypothetical protein HPB52_023450 [Rhipicephalus sanguineus]